MTQALQHEDQEKDGVLSKRRWLEENNANGEALPTLVLSKLLRLPDPPRVPQREHQKEDAVRSKIRSCEEENALAKDPPFSSPMEQRQRLLERFGMQGYIFFVSRVRSPRSPQEA